MSYRNRTHNAFKPASLDYGGTRFFGKRLTQNLINKNHNVTIMTRGNSKDDFGDSVERIICDRQDFDALKKLTEGKTWDIVYDQVCFDYKTAKEACEIFNTKAKKYVFTSTVSVYKATGEQLETDFDPNNYQFEKLEPPTGNYGEAKRQAEVAFTEFCEAPCAILRIPVVMGKDDYTERLLFHIKKVKNNEEIFFPSKEAKKSFIKSDDAAKALEFLGFSKITGIFNAASPLPIILSALLKAIENETKKEAIYAKQANDSNHSPYGISADWYVNCNKLKSAGLEFDELNKWLPKLIKQLSA